MRNKVIAKAGVAAAIFGCCGAAMAQGPNPTGLSARVGIFLPTSDVGSSTWYAFGIDYKLNSLPASVPGSGMAAYWGLSADYYAWGGDTNVPVVINYNLKSGPLTYSLGAGIDFFNVPDFNDGSGTGFDLQAGVGYQFGMGPLPFFLQAKYFLASRDHLRGFGIYAGIHF
ncbi:MAG TPA: hypothetical protein VG944_09385 [Fimbriimonas sp.]|nr:hypothetical protein [Fimbriimonas sp.]